MGASFSRRSLLVHPRERWGTFIEFRPLGIMAILGAEFAGLVLVILIVRGLMG